MKASRPKSILRVKGLGFRVQGLGFRDFCTGRPTPLTSGISLKSCYGSKYLPSLMYVGRAGATMKPE